MDRSLVFIQAGLLRSLLNDRAALLQCMSICFEAWQHAGTGIVCAGVCFGDISNPFLRCALLSHERPTRHASRQFSDRRMASGTFLGSFRQLVVHASGTLNWPVSLSSPACLAAL